MMNKIVSTVQCRDYILIFCENGDIYKMIVDDSFTMKVSFVPIAKFRPPA